MLQFSREVTGLVATQETDMSRVPGHPGTWVLTIDNEIATEVLPRRWVRRLPEVRRTHPHYEWMDAVNAGRLQDEVDRMALQKVLKWVVPVQGTIADTTDFSPDGEVGRISVPCRCTNCYGGGSL